MTFRALTDDYLQRDYDDHRREPSTTWASRIGHPCLRKNVLDRLRWRELPRPEIDGLVKMKGGKATEDALLEHLKHNLGCEITRQQEYVHIECANVGGKIEGFVRLPNSLEGILVEIKALTFGWEKIEQISDFAEPPFEKYYSGYPAQGMIYMHGLRVPRILWFICPKGNPYAYKEIWQEYSPTEAGLLVHKGQVIEDCIEHPERIPEPQWIIQCMICDHKDHCFGALEISVDERTEIEDPELEDALRKYYVDLKPAAAERDEIGEFLKSRLHEVTGAKCGNWAVDGKWVGKDARRHWRRTVRRLENA